MSDEGCICHGNWRKIIAECEADIGKMFVDENENAHLFLGVLHADDDYYYVMRSERGELKLLTCVGNIAGHGYKVTS